MKSIFSKSFIGVFLVIALLGGGAAAHASTLTQYQVQSVISLLQSFNVDQYTIAQVNAALQGQNTSVVFPPSGTIVSGCPILTQNLSYGRTDVYTGGQVSALQQFLGVQPIGVFGPMTRAAVASFQRQYGIYPVTGGVGPITREYIAQACSGGTQTPPWWQGNPTQTQTSFNFNTSFQVGVGQTALEYSAKQLNLQVVTIQGSGAQVTMGENCIQGTQCFYYPNQTIWLSLNQQVTFQGYTITLTSVNTSYATFYVTRGSTASIAPVVNSVSPNSGTVGSTVIIYGSGFTSDNTVMFGSGVVQHVAASNGGTQLYLTIPSQVGPACNPGMMCAQYLQLITPNTYTLSVSNTNGQSNSTSFTVTSQTNSNTTFSFTQPTSNQSFTRGQALPISWSANSAPSNSSVVLDLYTEYNSKIGTIAIPQTNAGYYSWSIPSYPQNYMCTMQYPNGLCGTNIPTGKYYIKATVTSDGFNTTPANTYATSQSSTFTINQQ